MCARIYARPLRVCGRWCNLRSLYVGTQPIKTCSIFCLSICLLISGSYAFSCILQAISSPYYFSTPRLFPVTLIFLCSTLRAVKSGKTSSLSPLTLGTYSTSCVPSAHSYPSSHPPLHQSHVPDMGVICLLCVRCNDAG